MNTDYRNTPLCPVLEGIKEKKRAMEEKIRQEHPKAKIFYNFIQARGSAYHKEFAEIYCTKCAYCGAKWGLLPVESFEIDHFINEASFPKTAAGRAKAGQINNLVWSCITCNRGKSGLFIAAPYDTILCVDNGNIAKVFFRDEGFAIQICDTYANDPFIKSFFHALHLDHEARRLDYLVLMLDEMCQKEKDEGRKSKLMRIQLNILKKRNMTVTAGGTS